MVSSNRLLTGVLKYAKEHKLCIPDDFSLAVFDDIAQYAYFTPSITAIRVDGMVSGVVPPACLRSRSMVRDLARLESSAFLLS